MKLEFTQNEEMQLEYLLNQSTEDLATRVIYYRRIVSEFKEVLGLPKNSTLRDVRNNLRIMCLVAPIDKSTT